jgi:hypothetical protein
MFELFLCTLISLKMLEIRELWTPFETFIFWTAMVLLVLSTGFFLFACYYLIFKQPALSKWKQAQLEEERIANFNKIMLENKK